MRREICRSLKWLAAGVLGLAVLSGPLAADHHEVMKLRVPVQLKKMLAEKVKVMCQITSGAGPGNVLASKHSEYLDIINGDFDQVVEMVMSPSLPEWTFANAKSYECQFQLKAKDAVGAPSQGKPPSKDLYRLARPDAFFRQNFWEQVGGKLGPDAFTGAKDLKALPPKKE